MTTQTGRPFNEWLRAQLKAKKMSQRQLAQASGVDHSTISRLVRGDRTPSLGTATKLARGLREIREDADAPQYLGLVSGGTTMNPTARIEYALRADDALGEAQVRQVMEYYLAVRMRRYARPVAPASNPNHLPAAPRPPGRDGARLGRRRIVVGRPRAPSRPPVQPPHATAAEPLNRRSAPPGRPLPFRVSGKANAGVLGRRRSRVHGAPRS